MLRQVLVAAPVCICTIVIHALVMTTVVRVAQAALVTRHVWHPWLRLSAVMIATVSVLMLAHVSEVLVWAATYAMTDAAPEGAALVYFAFVNYTTLGYGDITPVPRWLLLGPITAMNGILLFGWSTAVLFEVLRKTMEQTGSPMGPSDPLE
jgi:ion channel